MRSQEITLTLLHIIRFGVDENMELMFRVALDDARTLRPAEMLLKELKFEV